MAGENDAVTLLRYVVDNPSVAAAVAANKKVQDSARTLAIGSNPADAIALGNYAREFAALSARRIAASEEIARAEALATYEQRRQLELAQQLTREQQLQAAFVSRSNAGGSFGGGVSRASRALFNLPDVQLTPGISTTVVSRLGLVAGGALEAVGASLGAVATGAAVALPLIAGVVAVTSAYGREAQLATERASTFTEAFKQALEAGTTAQIQELIKRQQIEIRIAEITRDLLVEKQKEAPEQLANFLDNASQDLAARLNQAAFDIGIGSDPGEFPEANVETAESYNAAIEEQNKIISDGEIALEAFRLALGELFVQTNDAAEAENRLREIRQQAVEEIAAGQNEYQQAFVRGQGLTTEQRQDEINSLAQQKIAYEQLIASGRLSHDQITALNNAIDSLDNRYAGLTDATSEYGDMLARIEAQEKARTAAYDNYNELLDQEADAREKVTDIQERMTDLQADAADRLEDLAEDRADRLEEIQADSTERLAELAQQGADARLKIERDFDRSHRDAVRTRNVVEDIRARERRGDALQDQQTTLDRQTANVSKQLEKQEASVEKSYNKQVANVNDSLAKQLAIQNRALDEQEFLIAQSQVSQAFIVRNGFVPIENEFAAGMARIAGRVNAAFTGIGGGVTQFPVNYNTAPPLTGSEYEKALKQKVNKQVDTRLRQVWK